MINDCINLHCKTKKSNMDLPSGLINAVLHIVHCGYA